MAEPSLDLQKALRQRLISTSAVTALVPAANILDKSGRPEVFPCILLGADQVLPGDLLARNDHTLHPELHIWTKENSTVGVKQIAGAIREALADRFYDLENFRVGDLYIDATRYMRDPDGLHSHSVMTLCARLIEAAT